ncbi:MAG: hypothetical protein [Circoviridae sp.]|nr:MAG: hypothetical protein [Circoviridae sp.]
MPTSKKKSVDKRQSKDIKVLKKKVKALQKPIEKKFLDTPIVGTVASNNAVYVLNNVRIASEDGTITQTNENMSLRRGKSISMQRIRIKGLVKIVANFTGAISGDNTVGRVRMLVVRWHENDGAATSLATDFLTPADYAGAAPPFAGQDDLIDAYKKKRPQLRYDVLYDKTVSLQSYAQQIPLGAVACNAAPVYPPHYKVNIDLKLKHDARWALQESTTSPTQNPICLYVIGANGSATAGTQRYSTLLNARLNYTDM